MAFQDSGQDIQPTNGAAAPPPFAEDNKHSDLPAPNIGQGVNREVAEKLKRWSNPLETPNIAEEIKDQPDGDAELQKIGMLCKREFDIDEGTLSGWRERYKEALRLAQQIKKTKTHPWPECSNIIWPTLTSAAIHFAARAYPAIVPGRDVVKGVVYGGDEGTPQMGPEGFIIDPQTGIPPIDPRTGQPAWAIAPGAKRKRATLIGEHMSYQFLEEMEEWEEDTDRMLHILPIVGSAFRKTYFDPGLGRNVCLLVLPGNFVVNYWAKSIDSCPRLSENVKMYPHEIEDQVRSGLFLKFDMGPPEASTGGDDQNPASSNDEDSPRELVEQHRLLDLDKDGYKEPYVVTYRKNDGKVMRIVSRYEAENVKFSPKNGEVLSIKQERYYTQYNFMPSFDGSLLGTGFGQLLGPINESINTAINQMFDAGSLQNMGGGFIGRGLSLNTGVMRRAMGEWSIVNSPGGDIRNAIVPLEHQGPSQTMFHLLGMLDQKSESVSSITDVLTGEVQAQTMQPTTLLALIEQGTKVFTGIYKRIYRSAGKDAEKAYRLNQIYLERQTSFQRGEEWKTITREDYRQGGGVKPASDPAMVSDMQKAARAQLLQSYQADPYFDPMEIRRRVMDAASIPDSDRLLVKQPPQNPEAVAKLAEMEMQMQNDRVTQIKDMAQAVKFISEAEKNLGMLDQGWAANQIELLKWGVETLNGQAEGEPPGANGGEGGPGQQPPVPNARQAPDGQWYVDDPERPGKFLRVRTPQGAPA